MVQIGEKDQGCKMINGVEKQYPKANQSVIQKAKYESKNLNVLSKTHKLLLNKLKDKRIFQMYKKFENSFNTNEDFMVAVSGGPDSLALSFFAKIYSIKKYLNVRYFIVDHKLRKNSTSEAKTYSKTIKKVFYKFKYFNLEWNKTEKKYSIYC